MLRDVELVVVDAENDCDVLTLGRSGDDDLLRTRGQVALGLFRVGKETSRLDHELDAQFAPRQFGRGLGTDHENLAAVHNQDVILELVGR